MTFCNAKIIIVLVGDDQKLILKKIKQQILAFVLRQGRKFEGGKTYWTIARMKGLKNLDLRGVAKETLSEYLVTYEYLVEKIARLDNRIEELASLEKYKEKVKNMGCFLGIKIHTALSMIVEIGDFNRFEKAPKFAGFLGLVPSEDSSGDDKNRYGITKAGNSHLRRLMVEAAQSYTRGTVGHKSIALKQRQQGCSADVIAYADAEFIEEDPMQQDKLTIAVPRASLTDRSLSKAFFGEFGNPV